MIQKLKILNDHRWLVSTPATKEMSELVWNSNDLKADRKWFVIKCVRSIGAGIITIASIVGIVLGAYFQTRDLMMIAASLAMVAFLADLLFMLSRNEWQLYTRSYIQRRSAKLDAQENDPRLPFMQAVWKAVDVWNEEARRLNHCIDRVEAGFADWESIRPAIERAREYEASLLVLMRYVQFIGDEPLGSQQPLLPVESQPLMAEHTATLEQAIDRCRGAERESGIDRLQLTGESAAELGKVVREIAAIVEVERALQKAH